MSARTGLVYYGNDALSIQQEKGFLDGVKNSSRSRPAFSQSFLSLLAFA